MKDRIRQFMDYKGIIPGELAELLEVQRSGISHILNGRNRPGAQFLEKFLNQFPEIDARWLITGYGAMMSKENIDDYSPDNIQAVDPIVGSVQKLQTVEGRSKSDVNIASDTGDNTEIETDASVKVRETSFRSDNKAALDKDKERSGDIPDKLIFTYPDGTFKFLEHR